MIQWALEATPTSSLSFHSPGAVRQLTQIVQDLADGRLLLLFRQPWQTGDLVRPGQGGGFLPKRLW